MKRAEFLAGNYNPKGLSVHRVKDIVTKLDKACDRLNEKSGCKRKAGLMYKSVLKRLGYKAYDDDVILENIVAGVNKLFFEYPPDLLNDNILNILSCLKKEGYNLNISSNTGFIEGAFLRQYLHLVNLDQFFDFLVFSDEINLSKPSWGFFDSVYKKTKREKHEILHIGDNLNADFLGASQFGFKALLIENKEYSLGLIKKAIHEENRKF